MINESYATATEADDYIELTPGSEDWTSLSDTEKEQYLITATRQIERLKPKYDKLDSTQTLNFPVSSLPTTLGDGLTEVKEATILQAYYLFQHNDEITQAEQNKIQGTKQQAIGKLSQTQTGYNAMARISPEAIQILSPYVDMTVRATR